MNEINESINPDTKINTKKQKMLSLITCLIFCICIASFCLISFIKKPKSYSESERRYLEQRPEFTKETIFNGTFASKYELYVTDQFVGRDSFIQIKTMAERLLGKQDTNGVYFAKDDYLIEKFDVNEETEKQFTKNQTWIADFLVKMVNKLGDEHVRALLVPTAEYVLQSKLPPYANVFDQTNMNRELYHTIAKKASEKLADKLIIDVNQTLLDKANEYIYYRTDHHWTTLGAYYAYCDWAKSMGVEAAQYKDFKQMVVTNDFKGTIYNKVNSSVKPDVITLCDDGNTYQVDINMGEKSMDSLYDLEQLKGVDKYSVFLGGNNAMVQINSSNQNKKRLLVIKDSYAHSFTPFLAHHYEQVVLVDLRYLNMGMEEVIEQLGITDVLLLYNNSTVMSDKNIVKLTK